MRTTLDIGNDVLVAVKAIAQRDRRSVGEVITELARASLAPRPSKDEYRNGILLIPVREGAGRATLELVNELRDEAP